MNKSNTPDLTVFEDNSDFSNIQDLIKWAVLEEAALLAIKKEYTDRKEALAATKEKLAQMFRAKGIKTYKMDNGLAPCRMTATKFWVDTGVEQEQLCEWFEKNGLGESIKRSINFQTMNSILNDRKDAGETIPDHLVCFSERDSLQMNGKTKFLGENKLSISLPEIKVKNGSVEVK